MTTTRLWTRSLAMAAALAAALVTQPAAAAETAEKSVLDGLVKDLGLSLLSKPEDTTVRLPLAQGGSSLLGRVQPYASLSPRVIRPGADDVRGLAAPVRDPAEDLSKGVGVGAGVSWHLSDRLEVFGQYQLMSVRGRTAPTDSPLGRRDIDNPGMKGGLSIRF
jgi:hypothetical protein